MDILRLRYILVFCSIAYQKKIFLHVSFSDIFSNSFHVIVHLQNGFRVHSSYYRCHLVLIPLKILPVFFSSFFFNQFGKNNVEIIESIRSSLFFEDFFFINIVLKHPVRRRYLCTMLKREAVSVHVFAVDLDYGLSRL